MIGIINYGVGNIKAFSNIYKRLNVSHKVVSQASDFDKVSKIILPGVGSFDYAMQKLQQSGMRGTLDELVVKQKLPVLGICVGMQLLAKRSDEGVLAGLGWINAIVKKFPDSREGLPLPHMGWNELHINKQVPLFFNMPVKPRFYFLHSYYFDTEKKDQVLASTKYIHDFDCVVACENIFGIQCHPEKSHQNGINLLKNFYEL